MLHCLQLVLRGAKLRWHVDIVKHVLTGCLGHHLLVLFLLKVWLMLRASLLFMETLRLVYLLMMLRRVENYWSCFFSATASVIKDEHS